MKQTLTEVAVEAPKGEEMVAHTASRFPPLSVGDHLVA